MKEWKKIFQANGDKKKAGVAILTSDKIDFKTRTVTKDKEEYYIIVKESVQQEDITFVSIYAPNLGAPKYVKQILIDIREILIIIQ